MSTMTTLCESEGSRRAINILRAPHFFLNRARFRLNPALLSTVGIYLVAELFQSPARRSGTTSRKTWHQQNWPHFVASSRYTCSGSLFLTTGRSKTSTVLTVECVVEVGRCRYFASVSVFVFLVGFYTRSQAVARIADRTASQQTLVISDCCWIALLHHGVTKHCMPDSIFLL